MSPCDDFLGDCTVGRFCFLSYAGTLKFLFKLGIIRSYDYAHNFN